MCSLRRIRYSQALYHIMPRGNCRELIYREGDRVFNNDAHIAGPNPTR